MRARDLTDSEAHVAAWIGGIPTEGKSRGKIDAAIEGWPPRERTRSMNPTMVVVLAGAATVLGTVGGVLEKVCKPGSGWYKVGVVLASIGPDLASLATLKAGAP